MFEIEVVRFDAQDVIATSVPCTSSLSHFLVKEDDVKAWKYTYNEAAGGWVKSGQYTTSWKTKAPGWYDSTGTLCEDIHNIIQ